MLPQFFRESKESCFCLYVRNLDVFECENFAKIKVCVCDVAEISYLSKLMHVKNNIKL